MVPSRASKSKARASRPARPRPVPKSAKKTAKKAAPSKPSRSTKAPVTRSATSEAPTLPPVPAIRRADGRRHLLSLSFVRDGDEFLARMETDSGHITELKNRALDQLLTLVAGELEDLLE